MAKCANIFCSPRAFACYVIAAGLLVLACVAYVFGAFPCATYLGCSGIRATSIALSVVALALYVAAAWYFGRSLITNRWPWKRVVSESYDVSARGAELSSWSAVTPTEGSAKTSLLYDAPDWLPPADHERRRGCCGRCVHWQHYDSCATKTVRITCLSFCSLVTAAVYAFGIIAVWLQHTTLPNLSAPHSLSSLSAPAHIYREQYDLLHVEASNLLDVATAQGFAHAQLRMWEMEFQRRVASGTLSAVAGSAALDIDKAMRTLGVYPAANASYFAITNTSRALLAAYAAGVNAYIDGMKARKYARAFEFVVLGYYPQPWTPVDSLSWAKLMSYSLSGNMDKEVLRYNLRYNQSLSLERINQLMPPFDTSRFPTVLSAANIAPPYGPNVSAPPAPAPTSADVVQRALAAAYAWEGTLHARAPPASTGWADAALSAVLRTVLGSDLIRPRVSRSAAGTINLGVRRRGAAASNNWVVGGSRTASGRPLLANDPHLQFYAPSVWILNHLKASDGSIDVSGASFLGIPGVVLGHNTYIAWAVTNTGADCQDTYIMTGNETHYLYQGAYVPYVSRQEVVSVKGAADEVITVRHSVYGPVVTDNGFIQNVSVPLSLRWTSTEPSIADTTIDAFFGIMVARNWTEFRQALSVYIAPSQNFMYADVAGNIGYQMSGYIPARNVSAGHTGAWPAPGQGDTAYDWLPRIPYDSMPRTYNPPEDFLVSANNQVPPPSFPIFISADWDEGSDGYRAERIIDRIKKEPTPHTVATMESIEEDYLSYLARDICNITSKLNTSLLRTSSGVGLVTRLSSWDNHMLIGSTTATLFAQVYRELARLAAPETGQDYWTDFVFMVNALQSDTSVNGTDPACIRLGFASCSAYLASVMDTVGGRYQLASDGSAPTNGGNGNGGIHSWGDTIHHAKFVHQVLGESPLACLANREIAHGGDDSTVNVGHMDLTDSALTQDAGPSFRHIADLSNLEASVTMQPMGQSGNTFSWDYDSLNKMWSTGGYLTMFMSDANVQSHAVVTQTLNP